VNAVFSIDRTS